MDGEYEGMGVLGNVCSLCVSCILFLDRRVLLVKYIMLDSIYFNLDGSFALLFSC